MTRCECCGYDIGDLGCSFAVHVDLRDCTKHLQDVAERLRRERDELRQEIERLKKLVIQLGGTP